VPFFAYPNEIRKIIYTTNAIESLHMQLRKVLKTRGHFPSDEAATKLIYLALRDITKKWKNPRSLGNWRQPNLPFDLVKDSLPWRSEKVKPIISKARKTNDGRWRPSGSTRDLPTIAFFRAGTLLRRSINSLCAAPKAKYSPKA
jgi:Transposase, Mutator family